MKFRMPNAECDSTELVEVRIQRRPRWRRGGFSFTEILFAVMILGIGFIMVAAMFPVAIRQTEAGSQETAAAATARSSSNIIQELATTPLLPPPPLVQASSIRGVGPIAAGGQVPSPLLPTFSMANLITLNAGYGSYVLRPGETSMVVPGQVWTMCDTRDGYFYSFTSATTYPPQHNLLLWQAAAKNMIEASDPRFGWAMMYRRDMIIRGTPGGVGTSITPAPFAQIICISLQCRNSPIYDPTRDTPPNPIPPNPMPTSLLPNLIGDCASNKGVTLAQLASGVSYINFGGAVGPTAALADGAYVVICDDNVPATTPVSANGQYTGMYLHGALNGRVFRLGGPGTAASPWPLLPGSDLTTSDMNLLAAMSSVQKNLQFNVLVVGRGLDPAGSGAFIGPAQDVTAFTAYVPVPN